ncbi:hypothetical protein [Colwellia sp. MEBiC06753]
MDKQQLIKELARIEDKFDCAMSKQAFVMNALLALCSLSENDIDTVGAERLVRQLNAELSDCQRCFNTLKHQLINENSS